MQVVLISIGTDGDILPFVGVGTVLRERGHSITLAAGAHYEPLATAHGFLQQGADGSWYLSWDTGYLTNGNYSIALDFLYNPNAQPPMPVSVVGQTKNVQVTNVVTFNQLNTEFTDIWFIDVTFPYQNADFRIELYDADGSGLVYFEGSTTDGNVQGWWDLTIGGQQISFSHIRTDVFVAPAALPTKPSGRRWFAKQAARGIGDTFVVAWGWDNYSSSFEQRRTDLMLNGVINIIGDPSRPDEYQLRPGVNVPYGNAFRFDDSTDRKILMAALSSSDSGNFFWFGHGGTSAITGNGDKAKIDVLDVEEALKNKKHRSKPPLRVFGNDHPYRLVILNACETYSAGWANAFGVDYSPNGTTNDVLAYIRQRRQPQAFVGWEENIEVPISGADSSGHTYYATALAYLFYNWMEGYLLEEGLRQYADYLYVLGYDGHRSWKISGAASLYRGAP